MGQQRDAAVAGDDQPQSDQAQVGSFLLRFAPLRDRRLAVAGVSMKVAKLVMSRATELVSRP